MSMSQITSCLFLSGADAPLNQALVSRKGITLIVNATLNHACPAYPGVECLRVPVSDLPTARLGDHFDRVAERIHRNQAGGTLVHCAAGMSRSPALVMAYLMRYRGATLQRAHAWVRENRPFVRLNSGFWAQLLEYERRLYGKNTVKVAELDEPLLPQTRRSTLIPDQSPLLQRKSLFPDQSPLLQRKSLFPDQSPLLQRKSLFPDQSPLLQRKSLFPDQSPLLQRKSLFPDQSPLLQRKSLFPDQSPLLQRKSLFPDQSPLPPRSLLSSRSLTAAKRSRRDRARALKL